MSQNENQDLCIFLSSYETILPALQISFPASGWKCCSIAALPPTREAEPLERHSQVGDWERDNLKSGSRQVLTLS
ncbi:hypothetical protein KBT16_23250 [Nostoc sp. CCCryo 231-06]|nr:hypothetical protein [Nostoc sp. CCCryo 231-06]